MRKAMLAFVLAGTMMFGASAMTYAEEATEAYGEITEVYYDQMTGAFEGTWLTCMGMFDLYLPSDWDVLVNADLTEEAPENNVYFQACSEDQTRSAAISAAVTDAQSVEDLEAGLTEAGMENINYMYINDIYCLTYTVSGDVETAGICALGDNGVLYNVTIGAPADDKEFGPMAADIIMSFSPTEMLEAETEA